VLPQQSTSVADLSSHSEISVYPVPTIGEVTIDFSETDFNSPRIELLGVNGRLIHSQNLLLNRKIDLTDQLSGVYVLKLFDGNELIGSQRILVQ
jgi:hypothetical protein